MPRGPRAFFYEPSLIPPVKPLFRHPHVASPCLSQPNEFVPVRPGCCLRKGLREGSNAFRMSNVSSAATSRAPSPAVEGETDVLVKAARVEHPTNGEVGCTLSTPLYWIDATDGVPHVVCAAANSKLLCLVYDGRQPDRPWCNDRKTSTLAARVCKCLGGKLTTDTWGPFLYALSKGSGVQRDVDAARKQYEKQAAAKGVVLLRYSIAPPSGVPLATPASLGGPVWTVSSVEDSPAPALPAGNASAVAAAAARAAAEAFDGTAAAVAARVDDLASALQARGREIEQLRAAQATHVAALDEVKQAAARRERDLTTKVEDLTRRLDESMRANAALEAAAASLRTELAAARKQSIAARLELQDAEMAVHTLRERVEQLEAEGLDSASAGAAALGGGTSLMERLLARMDAVRQLERRVEKIEATDRSPSRAASIVDEEEERRVLLRKTEVGITVRPWLQQVQLRALALRATFPKPKVGSTADTVAAMQKSKLFVSDLVDALFGADIGQRLHNAIVATSPLPIVATPEATLASVVCNTFFERQGGHSGFDDVIAFTHAAKAKGGKVQPASLNALKVLLLRVSGADRTEEAANLLFVLSFENFLTEWGFTQRENDLPLRPERRSGTSTVDIGVVVALLYTLAGVKKEHWSPSLWAEKTMAKNQLPCVPPLHLMVPTDKGDRKVALQWDFAASS